MLLEKMLSEIRNAFRKTMNLWSFTLNTYLSLNQLCFIIVSQINDNIKNKYLLINAQHDESIRCGFNIFFQPELIK